MRRDIRLLVLGDEQVGKTSIITTLLTDTYASDVPHALPEIAIPPNISPDNVNTVIVDSSALPEDRQCLEAEIKQAQVICLVYAVDDSKTFSRASSFWLPYIRSLGANVPVVLVGNKIDTRGSDISNPALEDQILPIMNDFKEVETCVECSARTNVNIKEVFYFAHKSLLHPTAPLYDSREQDLKPLCQAALRRIFNICDINKDGLLDDEELNQFQLKCFGIPLQQLELEAIKDLVRDADPTIVTSNGLTVEGFLYLHRLFIQRGKLETTWNVLRKFGYDDDLSLRDDFLHPSMPLTADSTVELSPMGYQFFTELFAKFDRDKDGVLSWSELEELFSTAPGNPWLSFGYPETTVTDEMGGATLQGFLAQWSMITLLDYRTTLEYLAHLGFPGDTRLALRIMIRGRRLDRKKERAKRDVFLCLVVGAIGSGKTSLLRALTGKSFTLAHTPTFKVRYGVSSVDIGGMEKFLVLEEVSQHEALDQQTLTRTDLVKNYDVVCYVYDSSDANSFAYVAGLRQKYEVLTKLPGIFVATKSDQDRVSQRYDIQPDVYCRQLGIPAPISVSPKEGMLADLFPTIIAAAISPAMALPIPFKDKYRRQIMTSALIAGASLTILFTAFAIFRLARK